MAGLGQVKRIAVVITARPSYSRIKTALLALRDAGADLQIIAAASALTWRHGRVVDVIRADGLGVACEMPSVVDGGGTAGERRHLRASLPFSLVALLVHSSLTAWSPLPTATKPSPRRIAAAYQHIPLAHIQGGEVSGSIDDKVRNAVTQLADLHLVATQ